jgi:hypothetical protein
MWWFQRRRREREADAAARLSAVRSRCAQWGPHNRNPAVLYIDGIYESLPVGTLATAEKHWRRTADRAGAT